MNITRLKTITWAIISVLIIITARFFYWQVLNRTSLSSTAKNQSYKIENLEASRGKIYTSDKFPLVTNQTYYKLSLYKPNFLQSTNDVIDQIVKIKPEFKEKNKNLIEYFSQENIKWYTFPDQFSQTDISELKNIPGISFTLTNSRYFPENELAKTIVGTIDPNTQIGIYGLEKYYNRQLEGKNGFFRLSQDALGQPLLLDSHWLSRSIPGTNLYLYLNRYLQSITEAILKEGIDRYQADSATITIIKPETGGVLAMASAYATTSATPSASFNPIIAKLFEPGSIFKPLVVAAALDSNSITMEYICSNCQQPKTIGNATISNWNNELHPNSSLRDIIKNSDNIGMANIIESLGSDKFKAYFKKLDLDQKTAIDLPGEVKPPTKKTWGQLDLAAASFGQGIAMSQIQIIKAFNALANLGNMTNPKIVKYLETDSQTKTIRDQSRQVFSSQTAAQLASILKYATENGAVGKIKPKQIEVCAKSGTAQIAINGQYSQDSTIASYIGFSPCQNPKFTMIVTIDNPRTSPWGSSTAAPIWFELAQIISNFSTDSL